MKLVCDLFHSQEGACNYTYLYNELAAGPKTTDHTFQYFIDFHVDSWVRSCL